jgi:FkbM family methyltransferase
MTRIQKFSKRVPGLLKKGVKNPSRIWRSILFKTNGVFFPKRLLKARLDRSSARMLVTPCDPGLSQQLYVWGWRESVETDFVRGFLQENDVVIDIGANIGFYVILEAESIGPGGRILAVEPSGNNIALLRRNIALNGFEDRVKYVHAAISDKSGEGTLYLTKHYNLNSMSPEKLDKFTDIVGTETVPVFGFGDLLQANGLTMSEVNLIRMDVEGHEVAILRGMAEYLDKAVNLGILMEIHPELIEEMHGKGSYGEVLDILEHGGFEIKGVAKAISSRESVLREGLDYAALRRVDEVYGVFLVKGNRSAKQQ